MKIRKRAAMAKAFGGLDSSGPEFWRLGHGRAIPAAA
jgi:hypothetical protein